MIESHAKNANIDWSFYKEALGSTLLHIPTNLDAPHPNKIFDDSRTPYDNGFFVPITGMNFDAHDFIENTLKNPNVTGALCQKSRLSTIPKELHSKLVVVVDTLVAYQKIASAWRTKLEKCHVVALTGSSGKTTNKELLNLALQRFGRTVCPEQSFNNEVGVPKTILKTTLNDDFLILELGARHRNDIKFLTELASPDVAICLNVGKAHIGEFGGIDNTYLTKTDIFRSGRKNAVLVANADDQRILAAAHATEKKVITFGKTANSIKILSNTSTPDGVGTYLYEVKDASYSNMLTVNTPSCHEKTAVNIASVLATCLALNLDLSKAAESFLTYKPLDGRFSISHHQTFTLIDDAYNSNPDSLISGINSLKKSFRKKSKLLVLGDMLELGENSVELHEKIGHEMSRLSKVVGLLTVGEDSIYLSQAFARTYSKPKQVKHYSNIEELMKDFFLHDFNPELIYIKGSNATKLSALVTQLKSEV